MWCHGHVAIEGQQIFDLHNHVFQMSKLHHFSTNIWMDSSNENISWQDAGYFIVTRLENKSSLLRTIFSIDPCCLKVSTYTSQQYNLQSDTTREQLWCESWLHLQVLWFLWALRWYFWSLTYTLGYITYGFGLALGKLSVSLIFRTFVES